MSSYRLGSSRPLNPSALICSYAFTEKTSIKDTLARTAEIKSNLMQVAVGGINYGKQYTATQSIQSQSTTTVTEDFFFSAKTVVAPNSKALVSVTEYGVSYHTQMLHQAL